MAEDVETRSLTLSSKLHYERPPCAASALMIVRHCPLCSVGEWATVASRGTWIGLKTSSLVAEQHKVASQAEGPDANHFLGNHERGFSISEELVFSWVGWVGWGVNLEP